jgi:hypothetical protein
MLSVVGCLAAAVGIVVVTRSEERAQNAQIPVEAAETFTSSTLTDWVSIADSVVQVRVVDETRYDSSTPEERARGEGLVGRRVSVNVVETLWQRPDGSPTPALMQFDTLGWLRKGTREVRMVARGGGRLDEGRSYIFPAVYLEEERLWAPLTSTSVAELDLASGRVLSDPNLPKGAYPARDAIAGKSLSDLKALLNTTPQSPGLAGLDPLERQVKLHGGSLAQVRQSRGLPARKPAP